MERLIKFEKLDEGFKKYNEDQPRDEAGRFSSDGGGGGSKSREVTPKTRVFSIKETPDSKGELLVEADSPAEAMRTARQAYPNKYPKGKGSVVQTAIAPEGTSYRYPKGGAGWGGSKGEEARQAPRETSRNKKKD